MSVVSSPRPRVAEEFFEPWIEKGLPARDAEGSVALGGRIREGVPEERDREVAALLRTGGRVAMPAAQIAPTTGMHLYDRNALARAPQSVHLRPPA